MEGKCEAQAVAELEKIFCNGVQVEWLEFDNFLSWQLYCEAGAIQTSVQVTAHVIDTALKAKDKSFPTLYQ